MECKFISNNGSETIKCINDAIEDYHFCIDHQDQLYTTEMQHRNKMYISRQVRDYLSSNDEARSREEKIFVTLELFDYLIRHNYFLKEYVTFGKTVEEKLHELHEDAPDHFPLDYFLPRLFPDKYEKIKHAYTDQYEDICVDI